MTPFETLNEVRRRTAEAVIAQSGLAHQGLRRHLRELLGGDDAGRGALLQQPVIEGAHPFVTVDQTMAALSGALLHRDLVAALDGVAAEDDEYRFPLKRRPFRHQLEAWRTLLADGDPQSVLVTSGTGSGKTECFLFPILSDLAAQATAARAPLEGVQAIMLYPLNALIESQRLRLSAWTKPFEGKLRYCLYNGDLPPNAKESERRGRPEQVIDRTRLRQSPPPVLVTNITMLEYMLARAEDQPIIDISRGKLKWIVLDEAHSLVGAAAAEIALLLRRVLLAFDVNPEQVRFAATSATIGSGERVREQLQRFLADVAGIPDARVSVIEGQRQMPGRPIGAQGPQPMDIRVADPALLYDTFGRDPQTWELVKRLYEGGVPLEVFAEAGRRYGLTAPEVVFALARAVRIGPSGEEERLAPIRLHTFERAVPGLWSCINPECRHRPADWEFGRIVAERADQCPSCRAPVLEIVGCTECGEVYLDGYETGPTLTAPLRNPPRDEFAFDSAAEFEASPDVADHAEPTAEADASTFELARLFATRPTPAARGFWLDRTGGWRVVDSAAANGISLLSEEHKGAQACPHCAPEGRSLELLRSLRFGAPFILGNAAPILLEGVEPGRAAAGQRLPSGGRRLLSFTDSRQGTARLAAKIQTESERNFVRSFIYHQLQASMRPPAGAEEEIARRKAEIADLERAFAQTRLPSLEGLIAERKLALAALEGENTDGIAWPELVNRLSQRIEVAEWIKTVWQGRDEESFSDASKIAEFLLLREVARRPKRANSAETLGLAWLRNPSIDGLQEMQAPTAFRRRGKGIEDWRAYLDAVLTWFVRANGAVSIGFNVQHWIMPKARLLSLVGPDVSTDGNKRLRAWPNGYLRANLRSRAVAFLVQGLGLDLGSAGDRDDLDDCLRRGWQQVQQTFSPDPERHVYDFSKTFIAPVLEAFWCPVTRRILDRAPFGLTPYGLEETRDERRRAVPISMPRHPAPMLGSMDLAAAHLATREWLDTDSAIADLRNRGAWNNISDRVALFADYARSAEHSAQQESARLRRYEREFKDGKINVLNCSTTMEMGVDIGAVSSVMMTNVPPSIANYRQRVGRAGRRGQAVALAFTFCKDRALDREAFRDPEGFLRRSVAAPKVSLTSRPIVQRHVNAYLLGAFMRERSGNALTMQIGTFIGCPADPKESRPLKADRPVEAFVEWLHLPATADTHQGGLATLTRRSVLEHDRRLVEDTRGGIEGLAKAFVAEWDGLVSLAKDEGGVNDAAKSRMGIELKRMCGEFLLSGLADRGFLPGHGFPTNVVAFMPGKEFKLKGDAIEDGARQRRAPGPQRSLDIAIRDYAPGSEVVLDGLVHKSAGVLLNWKRPASEENIAEIQSLRHHWCCRECGASDTARRGRPEHCPACGADRPESTEFLRPAGFSVDPRERAHAETDILTYVPPAEPVVSTREARWQNLPVPELGRFRCSREGQVYYSSRGGPGGHGYAVCLHCGRAEPDTDNRGMATPPVVLRDHKPLRYRKGQDTCPGNDRPFSIKRNISLGHEITTDVLELQPQHRLRRAAANALAIALREGLAQELGVEADEMGFTVDERKNALGAPAASLFLFDRATGGAGFAVSFEHLMRAVIQRAEAVLDCATPGCQKGCAACVLTSDAPDGKDELDRTAALAFLRNHLLLPQELAPEDLFVASASLSVSPTDEIERALRNTGGSSWTVFLPDAADLSSLGKWPLARRFVEWNLRGHPGQLVMHPAMLRRLSSAERLALRDFALQHHVDLIAATVPSFENGAVALATVAGAGPDRETWASRDAASAHPGPDWGRPGSSPVARGRDGAGAAAGEPVGLKSLLPPSGTKLARIETQLDGDLATFGERMADRIATLLQQCGAWPDCPIAEINYEDPFVCSPLVARLLLDTVAGLAKRSGAACVDTVVATRPPRSEINGGPPYQLWHNWREGADQKAVVESYAVRRGLRATLVHRAVPHGRFLSVRFTKGLEASIVLDQGFGAWMPGRQLRVPHDFVAGAEQQADNLASRNVMLARTGVGETYLVATMAEAATA